MFAAVSDVLSFREDEECIIAVQGEYGGDECSVARCDGGRGRRERENARFAVQQLSWGVEGGGEGCILGGWDGEIAADGSVRCDEAGHLDILK